MLAQFVVWLKEELKLYPAVLFLLILYGAALFYIGYVATQEDVSRDELTKASDKLTKQMGSVEARIDNMQNKMGDLDKTMKIGQMHRTSEEIFTLQERINDDQHRGKPIDGFLTRHLDELQTQHDDQVREMNWITVHDGR